MMRKYHDHQIYGLEHVPRSGPGLMVFNHSFATYDAFLVAPALRAITGRKMWGIADRLIFRTPVLGRVFSGMGFTEGGREPTRKLLQDGELVGLAPGGMREGLRSSKDKYRVNWDGRRGFVRLSVQTGCPIILAACPKADDIYQDYDNPVTPMLYQRMKAPLPIFRGLGPSLLPRPVRLRHLISEPIFPERVGEDADEAYVAHHHALVTERMNALLQDALTI